MTMRAEPTVPPPEADEEIGRRGSADLVRLHRALLWLVLLFAGAAFETSFFAQSVPTPLFTGMGMFFSWCAIAAIIQYCFLRIEVSDLRDSEYNREVAARRRKPHGIGRSDPPVASAFHLASFASTWQWVILLAGIVAAGVFFPLKTAGLTREDAIGLRIATVIFMGAGCAFYFFRNFAQAVAARGKSDALAPVLVLARIAVAAVFAAAALIFIFLSTNRDYTAWLGWALIGFTGILVLETLLRFLARFFQPKSLRQNPRPAGSSILLDALFGHGHGLTSALESFEALAGVKLREVSLVRHLRPTIELTTLAALVLGWLSTSLTAVPAGSRGVRVFFGKYQPSALPPGLHLTWPWPIEQLEIVATETTRQISLGFDKDLSGPVLWNETHVEGEKNLLVGDGETLLTINVPIFYRISDPVRYLETTSDAEQALVVLAERKLIQVAGSRDSFAVMIEERGAIADQLRKALQQEIDELGLGLEILFAGLKDVHPPVAVASAYQEVISAQEQKETTIDTARATRARALPDVNAKAHRMRVQEDAAYKQRVAAATGEAARFSAVIEADREDSELFRFRLKLDLIERVLGHASKTILGLPAQTRQEFYLDLRNTGELPPP